MSPKSLHHALGPAPSAKQVCCGCSETGDDAVLVPVNGCATTYLCAGCAAKTWAASYAEVLRRSAMAVMDALAPQVPA